MAARQVRTPRSIVLAVAPGGDGLQASVEYPLDRLEPATVRRWGEEYLAILEAGCRDPHRPLADLLTRPGAAAVPG